MRLSRDSFLTGSSREKTELNQSRAKHLPFKPFRSIDNKSLGGISATTQSPFNTFVQLHRRSGQIGGLTNQAGTGRNVAANQGNLLFSGRRRKACKEHGRPVTLVKRESSVWDTTYAPN